MSGHHATWAVGYKYMTEQNAQGKFNREVSFCKSFTSAHDVRVAGGTGGYREGPG